jgi:2-(1,2-epoxy-1,2-dihydrophenyl)acetyl-CoA isomerase
MPAGETVQERILQSLEHGLLTITINVPERRNALSNEVALLLLGAAQRAREDPEVRAVLLKGAGGTFCVGGDIKNLVESNGSQPTFEAKHSMMHRTMEITRTFHEMTKPVVAAVDGAAAGAGLSLALGCDLRVVGERAKITTGFAKIGVSGDYGGIFYLTKMVGSAKARELALLSPVLTGKEAHALGMMTHVVPDADVGTVAFEMAMTLARGPTVALGYLKKNINNAEECSLEAYLDAEALHQCRCLQTLDYQEATTAFVEKRTPEFVGR